jgi:8-oxo-dGTP pyrophosphatase MutT (NUDIX family)
MPTTLFVLVVVPHPRDASRYLVVQERDGTFYLPAGKVEPREDLLAAAIRETREETGVSIQLRGILGFDHESIQARQRMRFAFVGQATDVSSLKDAADEHSRGAGWFTKKELRSLPLRHEEVVTWIERYEKATALLPCDAYEPRLA